jgi:hypothetical protein
MKCVDIYGRMRVQHGSPCMRQKSIQTGENIQRLENGCYGRCTFWISIGWNMRRVKQQINRQAGPETTEHPELTEFELK